MPLFERAVALGHATRALYTTIRGGFNLHHPGDGGPRTTPQGVMFCTRFTPTPNPSNFWLKGEITFTPTNSTTEVANGILPSRGMNRQAT